MPRQLGPGGTQLPRHMGPPGPQMGGGGGGGGDPYACDTGNRLINDRFSSAVYFIILMISGSTR